MFKMPIPVSVSSVNRCKNDKESFYVDFLFLGGVISVVVPAVTVEEYKLTPGLEITGIFELKPLQIVRFDRPSSAFEPGRFLDTMERINSAKK